MKKKKLVIRLPVLRGHGVSSEEEAKIKVPHYESAPGATIIFSDDDIMLVSGQLQTLRAPRAASQTKIFPKHKSRILKDMLPTE